MGWPWVARGQAPGNDLGARVLVNVVGVASEEQEETRLTLASLLSSADVEVEAEAAIEIDYEAALTYGDRRYVAAIWLDLHPDTPRLLLADPKAGRVLFRRLEPGTASVVREQACQIVHSSVEALLGGHEVGATRAEARTELGLTARVEPPVAEPSRETSSVQPTTDEPPAVALGAFAGYRGALGDEHLRFFHGPSLSGRIVVPLGGGDLSVQTGVEAQALLPLEVPSAPVGVRLVGGAARLRLGVGWMFRPVSFSLFGTASLEVVHATPRVDDESMLVTDPAFTDVLPVVGLELRVSFILTGRLRVEIAAGLDIKIRRFNYVVDQRNESTSVLNLSRVQLAVALGVGWL